MGGLPGFQTWGYNGSFSFGKFQTDYPDPDPRVAIARRHLTIALSLGLGIPAFILLCAYIFSMAFLMFTWRRRAADRQICDRVHNIILKDPSKVRGRTGFWSQRTPV